MNEMIWYLYFRAMILLVGCVVLFGWLFPALISAADWTFTILGLLGLLISAPVAMYLWYVMYQDVMFVIKELKKDEEKK